MATNTKRSGTRRSRKRQAPIPDHEIFQGNTYNTPKGKPETRKGGKAQADVSKQARAFFGNQKSKGTQKGTHNELTVLPVPVEQEGKGNKN